MWGDPLRQICDGSTPQFIHQIGLFHHLDQELLGGCNAPSWPGRQEAFLAQVLYVEGGARTAEPYFLQVCREPDCAVMSICPCWITQRLPRGPEPEQQDLSKRR